MNGQLGRGVGRGKGRREKRPSWRRRARTYQVFIDPEGVKRLKATSYAGSVVRGPYPALSLGFYIAWSAPRPPRVGGHEGQGSRAVNMAGRIAGAIYMTAMKLHIADPVARLLRCVRGDSRESGGGEVLSEVFIRGMNLLSGLQLLVPREAVEVRGCYKTLRPRRVLTAHRTVA